MSFCLRTECRPGQARCTRPLDHAFSLKRPDNHPCRHWGGHAYFFFRLARQCVCLMSDSPMTEGIKAIA
eukprot:1158028-Pelagomonas_calceolata.AAC.8